MEIQEDHAEDQEHLMADSNRSNQNSTQIIASSIRVKLFQTYDQLPSSSQYCSIFRVPNMLRRQNEKAFTPEVVSIGPFHHGNRQLQAMEIIKQHYLNRLLYRAGITALECLVKAIQSIKPDCRKCYAEVDDLSGEKFIEMMLIDGCFILEFLYRYQQKGRSIHEGEDDPVFKTSWMPRKIIADLLLLENQLPWCVLDCLFNLIPSFKTTDQRCSRLDDLVSFSFSEYKMFPHSHEKHKPALLDCFRNCLLDGSYTVERHNCSAAYSPQSHEKHTHLLDCFRNCLLDGSCTVKRHNCSAAYSPHSHEKRRHLLDCFGNCLLDGSCTVKRRNCSAASEWKRVKPVTELILHGIILLKAKDGENILDVKFEEGKMKIPEIVIEENTESVFRNLIAFEHCSPRKGYEITSYAALLDCLIKSPADALELEQKDILRIIGLSNEDRASFLNRLLYNNDTKFNGFLYSDLCQDVNTIGSSRFGQWMKILRRDYFKEPWALVTFVLGIVFSLALSTVQTFYAAASYWDSNSKSVK
ncbi:hypothetical protein I3843_12G040500 [Carya illinoinensis]|nr:hypothetical protein I3843_12G040500 [Carya illinoinensis]